MSEPDLPGERYRTLFALPREEQITRVREQINTLSDIRDDQYLNLVLADIEYDIHTIREAIWCDDCARIREANRMIEKPKRTPTLPTTLEDLI